MISITKLYYKEKKFKYLKDKLENQKYQHNLLEVNRRVSLYWSLTLIK